MTDLARELVNGGPYDFRALDDARWRWSTFRTWHGLSGVPVPLLTAPNGNTKLRKTLGSGVSVYGLALAAHSGSGVNVCRFSTPACRAGCLQYAGRNQGTWAQNAQIVRTKFLAQDPEAFQTLLAHEIQRAVRKHGLALRVRLNVLSDIPWERVFPELFERFATVRFYDYTKWKARIFDALPPNYHVTFSASERTSDAGVRVRVEGGYNVAVVFSTKRGEALPDTYKHMRVIDGDANDNRTSDPAGVIVGLRAKGRMRKGNPMVRKVA